MKTMLNTTHRKVQQSNKIKDCVSTVCFIGILVWVLKTIIDSYMDKNIPTNKHKLKYLIDEGFIIKAGDTYRYLTPEEQKRILTDLKKNGAVQK